MKSSDAVRARTIGEAAARYGLATSVLRHWDAAGVLRPAFRRGGQRRYSPDDVYRIGVVLFCQEAGLSLAEIAQLLSTRRPITRRAMLRRKEADLDARIAGATAARRMVREVMWCSAPDPLACPRFRATVDARSVEKVGTSTRASNTSSTRSHVKPIRRPPAFTRRRLS